MSEETRSQSDAHAAILRRHFPRVPLRTLKVMPHPSWGGESDVYLVDGHLIFRFPRAREAAGSLAVETCLLPQLAERVGLAIPRFEHVALDERDGLPAVVGYEAIRGQPLTGALFRQVVTPDRSAADHLARQLAAFLSVLHGFPLDRALACGVGRPQLGPREQVERQSAAVRSEVFPALADDERAWLTRLFEAFLGDERHFQWTPALCHGDLTSDHILFDADRQEIAGIIDFGDVCVGDRAGDFVWSFEYGDDLFDRVLAHYSPSIADPRAFGHVVAFRYGLMPTVEIAYGLETGNRAYVEEGRRELRARMEGANLTP